MSRYKAGKGQKKMFSRTARRTRAINLGLVKVPRGGYRL